MDHEDKGDVEMEDIYEDVEEGEEVEYVEEQYFVGM